MGYGEDDDQYAVGDEEGGQHIGQGDETLKRIPQQGATSDHRHQRREQRPSKARSLACSQGSDKAHDPRDEKQPSEDDGGEEARDGRNDDGGKPKDAYDYPLRQKQTPIVMHRSGNGG